MLFADCIPILVELRYINDLNDFDLLAYIHNEFMFAYVENTKQILEHGKILILLDGLDELSNISQQIFQKRLIEFCQQYYRNHFVFTTRVQAIEQTIPNFQYVEIAKINNQQVEIDAENVFINLAKTHQQGIEIKNKFIQEINQPKNKHIAELASSPFLFNFVYLMFFENEYLPSNRADLLDKSLKLILNRWDSSNMPGDEVYKNLTLSRKLQLLSYIAAINFEQNKYFFNENELINTISNYLENLSNFSRDIQRTNTNAETILKLIVNQHGILVQRSTGIYSFSHLIFQEYLTAKYIIENNSNIQDFQNKIHSIDIDKESLDRIKTLIKEIKPDMKI